MEIKINKPDFEAIKTRLFNNKNQFHKKNYDSKKHLFKSVKFNNLLIKNCFIYLNFDDNNFYDENDYDFGKYYLNIAKSNVGLILTGGVDINILNQYLNKSANIINLQRNIDEIHTFGTKIFFQIKHFMGRGIDDNSFINKFNYSVCFNRDIKNSLKPCVRLSDYKCNEMIYNSLKMCDFLVKSGFDGVFINADLFNILGEFSSIEFNRRYFGYYSNYEELAIKIVKAIIHKYADLNLIFSITVDSFLKEIFKFETRNIRTLSKINIKSNFDKVCRFLIKLVESGVDGFIFNFGTYENEFLHVFNEFQDEYIFYDYYKEIKTLFKVLNLKNKFGNDVYLIYHDNINNVENCGLYIKNNIIDFIDITKQILTDNNYINNLKSNIESLPCIKCGYCEPFAKNFNLNECQFNPYMFNHENIKCDQINSKKVAIIGAGLSGIMCALYLIQRGYNVELFELNNTINKTGRLLEFFGLCKLSKKFNDYIENLLIKNAKNNQITLNTGLKFEISQINNFNKIIVATGFTERLLNIKGSILKTVLSLYDILSDEKFVKNNDEYILYGYSENVFKFALYLISVNKNFSIILKDFCFIKKLNYDKLSYYFYILSNSNVNIYVDAKVIKIEHDFIEVVINKKINKQNLLSSILNAKCNLNPDREEKLISLDYNYFIYEPEVCENNKIYNDIISSGFDGDVYLIGNASKICSDDECIKSAYYVAKNL